MYCIILDVTAVLCSHKFSGCLLLSFFCNVHTEGVTEVAHNSEHHSTSLDYSISSHSCVTPKPTTDSTLLRVLDNKDKQGATSDHQAFKQNEDQAATGEEGSAHIAMHTAHTYTHTHMQTQHLALPASLYVSFVIWSEQNNSLVTTVTRSIEFFGRLVG